MGFNQQTSNRLHLLRHRHIWAVFALVEMVAQILLASQHYLHPRDVQWPLWRNLNVRWHLWSPARCTLWQDNNCHSRRYWRVLRHLWVSIVDICVLETPRSKTRSWNGVTAVVIREIGEWPVLVASSRHGGFFLGSFDLHTLLGVIKVLR